MSQKTLNSYFAVKKRPVDQHAAKTRKLEKTQEIHSAVVTTFKDDHVIPPPPTKSFDGSKESTKSLTNTVSELIASSDVCPLLSTPSTSTSSQKIQATNTRSRKRDVFGQNKETKESEDTCITRFTIGKNDTSNSNTAKRKLHMEEIKSRNATRTGSKSSTQKKVATFTKAGNLSPTKQNIPISGGNVSFEKKGALSPTKKAPVASEKSDGQKQTEALSEKITPAKVKAAIGKVTKLSDLKARIQELNKDKNFANTGENKHRRQLFSPPKLTKEDVTLEVETSKPVLPASPVSSPIKSGIKASPRKVPQYIKHDDLRAPDQYMPLPRKYRFLADLFRSVDDVVGMKYNRREIIRVTDIKPAIQNIIRKTFGDHYLRQIRCVFPKAYTYAWEKILDRMGRHSSGDYELQMIPDMEYNKSSPNCTTEDAANKSNFKLGPKEKVERIKIFKHSLLQIAKDYHQEFLINLGWTKDEADKVVTKWHPKFNAEEHCPDIDTVDFPPKPNVEKMSNAKDMIKIFAGVNPRLENVLQQRENSLEVEKKQVEENKNDMTKIKNVEQTSKPEEPKILKGLRGLPPAILQQILAKEKAKNIQDVTQNTEKRKEIEMMQELVLVAPCIVNCHRTIKNGAAVEIDILTKFTADSFGRGKTKEEMSKIVSMFLRLVPECMEIKKYSGIKYVKKKKDSPDINVIKAKLQKLVDHEKQH